MSAKRAAAAACLVLALGGAAGCEGPKPFLLQGDANSAMVGYSLDLAGAGDVAKKHCAQFERVPRFLEAQEEVAYYDCVKP
jgi:hypothetical protein